MIANDVIGWTRWAAEGKDAAERERRIARIQRFMFPDNLSEEEIKRRLEIVAYVQKIGEPPSWDGWPAPEEVPDQSNPLAPAVPAEVEEAPRSTWQGLVPAAHPAHMRASDHDGTGAQARRMRDLASGSPFDADADARFSPSRRRR